MKTKITITIILISLCAAAASFFSCDTPASLGYKLDLEGPIITIVSPTQRQSVTATFDIEGTAQDNSGIERLIIKAVTNNQEFPRQWRNKNGVWEVSDDFGTTWSPLENAVWAGANNSFVWKIPVDMTVNGQKVTDGEYTFNIQAWDNGGFTDDNSFKALVLIIDLDPPRVVITNPFLYSKYAHTSDPDFIKLDAMPDLSGEWQDPSYLGKFITQEFDLKWQIEDINDVWSFDIRFYEGFDITGNPVDIDNDPDTPLPENYIYRYYKNLPPPPVGADPNDFVKLNGSVTVPNLYDAPGIYDGGELKTSIPLKTTVSVVAVCFDAAGNPNQEKTLGYFISWPKANTPWIVFTDGMEKPDSYYGKQALLDDKNPNAPYIAETVFTVYPGRNIKGTAFQAHGVKEVKYTLYKLSYEGNVLHPLNYDKTEIERQDEIIPNLPYQGGSFSTIFPWEFNVPPFTGFYVFSIEAFSSQGVPSEKYEILFMVHDITFPDFTDGPYPIATDPLFMAMEDNKITIKGTVSDATEVTSLCLVWINPESRDFSAMSQLSYFRDSSYPGWKESLNLAPGTWDIEKKNEPAYGDKYPYDEAKPNKIWRLVLTDDGIDYDTNRKKFHYEQIIELSDVLNIGIGKQPLKSQIFLLRAENPDGKCTVITYAPQGDTLAPRLTISNVVIKNGGNDPETYTPNKYAVIPQFANGDTITINGTWWEDSVEKLPKETYFIPNFEITVNNQILPNPSLYNDTKVNGEWEITLTVGSGDGQLLLNNLKDTLVIGVTARDIGGNTAETGSSWLILSDNLRLMRISSSEEDGTFREGEKIEIFLEFSKPVKLANGGNPVLLLNSTGSGATARAVYKNGQNDQNSRQYFEYTVGPGHGIPLLNVISLENPGTLNAPAYPFTWFRGTKGQSESGYEEVRITTTAGYDGGVDTNKDGYFIRTLPTASNPVDSDYQFTLIGGKSIAIDTTAPTVTGINRNSNAGDYNTGDIYFTVTFSEDVKISATPPIFPLRLGTNGVAKTASYVRLNGKDITFMYSIDPGDTSNGTQIYVPSGEEYTGGDITDLAGNPLPRQPMGSLGQTARTLTGIYVDTVKPAVPVVRILSAAGTGITANAIVNNVSGAGIRAESGSSAVVLSNLYHDNIYLAIEGMSKDAWDLTSTSLEYSINNGTSWTAFGNITNTGVLQTLAQRYQIKARQKDRAGNVSDESNVVDFTWDRGTLISHVSSTSANGVYTHVVGRNQIDITVYFRKDLRIGTGTTPRITINAQRGGNNIDLTIPTASIPGGAVNSLTFTYNVQNGDARALPTYLDITAISGITAWDGNAVNNGVNVSSLITLPTGTPRLDKQITVETGNLTRNTITFAADSGTEANANYHGIRSDDGSYWTTLDITFNRSINKGSPTGNIIIQQIAGTGNTAYRLPAVITEAQYTRFKSNANTSGIIDNYYIKGTNGYIDGTGSDTSNKYVLQYNYDTISGVTSGSPFAGNTAIPAGDITRFRDAEKIEINVNASVVTVDGSTLKIRLTGSNAPQVPGATYTVALPDGLVTDSLGNIYAGGNENVVLRGVAKPFVRINKTQDTITVNANPSITQPRLVAAQPFLAYARMDCRTPGSTITYNQSEGRTNVPMRLPGTTGDNNNWRYDRVTPNANDNATPDATRPGSATGTNYTNSTQVTLGNNANGSIPDITDVQGYQWWVRARAGVNTTYSLETEEMAYRTVISYQIRNGNGAITAPDGRSIFAAGDQAWIRGGDAIGSSSIPGFPFTWEDDWGELKNKRAGIRLMTLVGTNSDTQGMNNSVWRFVTWDMNTTAYVDFIRGRDLADGVDYPASSADTAWQYGPKRWCYQVDGWTSFKTFFPIYAGKHRWCDTGYQFNPPHQAINFSGTFMARPSLTASRTPPATATYTRWPGLNNAP